jgi:hypothetical protein
MASLLLDGTHTSLHRVDVMLTSEIVEAAFRLSNQEDG